MRRSTIPGTVSTRLRRRPPLATLMVLGVGALSILLAREPVLSHLPPAVRQPVATLGWLLVPCALLFAGLVAGLARALRDWPRGRDEAPAAHQQLIQIETRVSWQTLVGVAAGIVLAASAGLFGLEPAAVELARYLAGGLALAHAAAGILMILAAEVRIVEEGREDPGTGEAGMS